MRHSDQEYCFITMTWGASGRLAPACQHYLWITLWWMICTWSQRDSWKALPLRLVIWQENAYVTSGGSETPAKTPFCSPWPAMFCAHTGGSWSKRGVWPGMALQREDKSSWLVAPPDPMLRYDPCLWCRSLFGCCCTAPCSYVIL